MHYHHARIGFLILFIHIMRCSFAQNNNVKDEFNKYGPMGKETYTDLKLALDVERYVYKLDLRYTKLDPKLYDKISKLTDLQAFRLSGNEITDYPKNFDALYNLVFFASYNNKFKTFPPNLKPFQNLTYLELQHTQIDSIPAQIAYLSRLRTFKFGNTDDTLKLPLTFNYLKNLKDVIIENCVMDSFPKQIFRIPNISFLYLSNTNTHYLTRHFERMPELEVLVIENNPITKLPFDIYKASKLRIISLRGNKIEKIPDSISQLENLVILDLRGNPIDKEEIDKLRLLLPGCEIKF